PMSNTKMHLPMTRFAKITAACLLGLALGAGYSGAFVLVGPDNQYPVLPAGFGDNWEIQDLGYNPYIGYDPLQIGPKNIGEEYRRNMPVLFYSYDRDFLQFFGSNGVAAVDQAFAMYNSLT